MVVAAGRLVPLIKKLSSQRPVGRREKKAGGWAGNECGKSEPAGAAYALPRGAELRGRKTTAWACSTPPAAR